jgi:hypothetical protein
MYFKLITPSVQDNKGYTLYRESNCLQANIEEKEACELVIKEVRPNDIV